MSGRSAYVRKKITETKAKGRPRKASADFHEDYYYHDPAGHAAPLGGGTPAEFAPPHAFDPVGPVGTGSTANTRLGRLPPGAASPVPGESGFGGPAITPTPTLASDDDFSSQRRRATLTSTDDGPGIEKSGLRTLIDRRSDNVRKGLAKTLGFMRKDKSDGDADESAMSNAFANPIYSRDNHSRESYGRDDYGYGLPRRPVHPVLQVPAAPPTATGSSPTLPSPWESVSSLVTSPSTAVTTPSSRMVSPLSPNTNPAPPVLVRRWIGSGVPVQRWNKLRKDPELWDPNGDVLVFLCQREQRSRAQPSFRLSSHIIEATGSRPLITLLREGSTEDATESALSKGQQQRVQQHQHQQHQSQQQNYRAGQPTPPISEDATSTVGDVDGQISYEMFFPAPPTISVTDQLRYHLATRNVFALLYHASLVGLTLYQALADLQSRLEACMPAAGADVVADMVNYLCSRGLDDVRADPGTAVGLLAWAEGATVRWEEGWTECFVHCAGMYPVLEPQCPDFRATTAVTRALLERAHLETRMRVHAAEERLAEFRYDDMWPATGPAAASGPASAAAAAARMQRFLVAHYARAHGGRWPPPPPPPPSLTNSGGGGVGGDPDPDQPWLTRIVVRALQRDFGALYDYLVDRDIVWDESEFRSGRKWVMVSSAAADRGRASFDADLQELPLTDILIEFDNRQRFPHIPHPYPLVPESIAPPAAGREGGLFRGPAGRKGSSGGAGVGAGDGNIERRVHLAYMDATNIYLLGSDFVQSDLLDAFIKFEKTDLTAEVNPAMARKGRWVLLYGILQTLASLSADAPGLRYKDGVPYHMCPRLAGAKLPPWRTASTGPDKKADRGSGEASHEDSHCWVAPRLWNEAEKGAAAVTVAAVADTLAANQGGGGASDEYPPTRSTMGRAETRGSSGSVKSNGTGAGLRQQPSSPQLSYGPLPQPLPLPPTHIHLVVPSPSIPSEGEGEGEGQAEGEAVEARFGVVRQGSIIDLSNRRNHHGHSGHHHHHSPKRMQSLDSISSSSVSRGGGASSVRGGGAPLTSAEVDHMMQLRRELGLVAGSRSKSGSVSEGSRGGGDSAASSHQGSLRVKTSGGGGGGDGAGWGGAVNATAAAPAPAPAPITTPPPPYVDYGDVDDVRNVAEEADVVVDADMDREGLMDELDQVSDMDDDDREYAIRTPRGVSPMSM